MAEDVRYYEAGASWYAVLAGPAFAAVGYGVELLGGPTYPLVWIGVAIVLTATMALLVYARRTHAVVRLTPSALTQGTESLSIARVRAVCASSDDTPRGSRVLGTGMANTVPRGCQSVVLRLDDGSTVAAWARDGAALRCALTDLVGG